MTHNSIIQRASAALLILAGTGVTVPMARAFFDELAALKQELVVWETTHAADFSDIINTLDDLSGTSFSDVRDEDWFGPYVASVSDWGIVSGYRDETGAPLGVFGPGNDVTIAEMLKMAFEAAQADEQTCGLVPSVLPQSFGHWAAKYVACGEAKGMRILQDPSIDLNRSAKRGEVLGILHDAFGDDVLPFSANFRDTLDHPYESDIAYAYMREIVSGDRTAAGVETGTFRPNDPINRAEVAKIIYERLRVDVVAEQ